MASMVAVGLFGLAVGVSLALVAAAVLEAAGVPIGDDLVLAITVTVVLQGVGFALVAVGYLRYRGLDVTYVRLRTPGVRDALWMVGGVLGLLGLLAMLNAVLVGLGFEGAVEHELVELARGQPDILLLLAPLSVLVIGPGEELLFRGVVQTRLVEAYGTATGIVATSVVFAAAHIPAYAGGGNVAAAIAALFVLSVALGLLFERTDNLVVPAVVHGVYNAVLFLALYAYLTTGVATIAG